MTGFLFFKMAAVHLLGFFKLEILTADTVWRVNVRHFAKFRADRSIYGHFSIFKMAGVRYM